MKIKICGIRSFDEAMRVIEAGADLLGFNFYPASPRYITPGDCMRLVVHLETALREEMSQVTLVGVFVNAAPDNIHAIFRDCHLDMIQLSGDEPPDVLERFRERAYKALRPSSPEELAEATRRYPHHTVAPAYLVDANRPGEYGGTGQPANWSLARQLAQEVPILLAGGLAPGNVVEAIRQVSPWGVDVASGVESGPGVKDMGKVKDFIQAARSIQEEPSA